MKHIFITHSNITKIIIEGIIHKLKLKAEEVLVVSFRGSKIEGYTNLDLESMRRENISTLIFKYSETFFKIKRVHKVIKAIDDALNIDTEFILYTPQVSNLFFQVIASHRYCRQINFIEEGTASFFWKDRCTPPPIQATIINRLVFLNRLPSCSFFDSNSFRSTQETKYFCYSNNAFIDAPNRMVISVSAGESVIEDDSTVFLLDAIVESGIGTEEQLMDVLNHFIDDCRDESTIYLKFHPQQRVDLKQSILGTLRTAFEVIILDSNVVMEREFIYQRKDKLKVYGIMSSLLVYASQSGHYTKSYLRYLTNASESIHNLYNKIGITM